MATLNTYLYNDIQYLKLYIFMIYIKYHSDLLPGTSYDSLLYMTTLSCEQHLFHIIKQLHSLMRCKNNKTKTKHESHHKVYLVSALELLAMTFHQQMEFAHKGPDVSYPSNFFSQDSTIICFGVFKDLFNTTLTTCCGCMLIPTISYNQS